VRFLRRRLIPSTWQLDAVRAINSPSGYVSFSAARNEGASFPPPTSRQKKENEYSRTGIILARNICVDSCLLEMETF